MEVWSLGEWDGDAGGHAADGNSEVKVSKLGPSKGRIGRAFLYVSPNPDICTTPQNLKQIDLAISGPAALPLGEYYIEATEVATGAVGHSPLYHVSHDAQRRRLYGPTMWA